MEDLFGDVVTQNVDTSVERTYSDGSPVISSGVSSGSKGSGPSQDPSPAAASATKCSVCGKVLKTIKGFEYHTFLHNIASKFSLIPWSSNNAM